MTSGYVVEICLAAFVILSVISGISFREALRLALKGIKAGGEKDFQSAANYCGLAAFSALLAILVAIIGVCSIIYQRIVIKPLVPYRSI